MKRLTLGGLRRAFIVLGFSYSLAIAAFIVEIVHGHILKNKTDKRKAATDVKSNKLNESDPLPQENRSAIQEMNQKKSGDLKRSVKRV